MKVVILAGGRGTRMGELTDTIPKPMLLVGSQPLLWHIMNRYARFFKDVEFLIAGGYRGDLIARWVFEQEMPWKIQVVDTGLDTGTGGRLQRLEKMIGNQQFMMTYGDGLSDVNLTDLRRYHIRRSKLVTITAVHPPPRFGVLEFEGDTVISFGEKEFAKGWINGGYMVVEPFALEFIESESDSWEAILSRLARERKVNGYKHRGFWECADTRRELEELNRIYEEGAPWLTGGTNEY